MGNWGYNPYSGVITVLLTGICAHFVHQCTSHLQPYSDGRSNGSFVEKKSMMWKSQGCFPIVELRPTCTCSVGRNTNKLYRDKIKMLAKKIKTENIWWGIFSNKVLKPWNFYFGGSKGSLLCQPKTCTIREIPPKIYYTFASSLIPPQMGNLMTLGLKLWVFFLRVFNIVLSGLSEFFHTPPFPFKTVASSISSVEMFSVSGSCFFCVTVSFVKLSRQKNTVHFPLYWSFNRDHLFLHQLWFFQGLITPLVEGKYMLTPNWPGWTLEATPQKSSRKRVFLEVDALDALRYPKNSKM